MSYRAEPKGSMQAYLRQRSSEEIAAERADITAQYQRSVAWLEKYHARRRKTAFNWSPAITVTKTEETTSEEVHHQEGQADGAQAAEIGIAEGVGDAPGEVRSDPAGSEPTAIAESRFAIAGHQDFGDGDTPF